MVNMANPSAKNVKRDTLVAVVPKGVWDRQIALLDCGGSPAAPHLSSIESKVLSRLERKWKLGLDAACLELDRSLEVPDNLSSLLDIFYSIRTTTRSDASVAVLGFSTLIQYTVTAGPPHCLTMAGNAIAFFADWLCKFVQSKLTCFVRRVGWGRNLRIR
jgi:hypothetical protein